MKNIALILASGNGSRCGLEYPKQFAKIKNKTILEYSIEAFENHALITEIIIVTNEVYFEDVNKIVEKYNKVAKVVIGGVTRRDSSFNGVMAIKDDEANVLIHDAARPLISEKIITNCINTLREYKAVCVTIPSTDTIFILDLDNNIECIPNRSLLSRAQTPQCFKLSLIKDAHIKASNDVNCSVTDDCGLVLNYTNEKIHVVSGSEDNIKVTYINDIEFVKSKIGS